ncbi:putative ABC transporter, P-loop containing nucleoside triphosphate hydrolase [Helianthus annuus]|nr:putative ABC transporter, P-loop containing nucleoside triphosphate hydrolase [Helianthus annuus]
MQRRSPIHQKQEKKANFLRRKTTFIRSLIKQSYGEIGLVVNEFLSLRWNKMTSTNTTIGQQTLQSRGQDFEGYYYWISIGALFGFVLLFNIGFVLALSYLKAPGTRAIISKEKISQVNGGEGSKHQSHNNEITKNSNTNLSYRKMVLPFEPLTITFQDLQYYVEPPLEMREHGFTGKRLQLLRDITGAFRPGVLTALMGVSGAGKTTLLDVLAGRKTSGIVEGEIRIGGDPKFKIHLQGFRVTVNKLIYILPKLQLRNLSYSLHGFDFTPTLIRKLNINL